jgi:hypothetical protein
MEVYVLLSLNQAGFVSRLHYTTQQYLALVIHLHYGLDDM